MPDKAIQQFQLRTVNGTKKKARETLSNMKNIQHFKTSYSLASTQTHPLEELVTIIIY